MFMIRYKYLLNERLNKNVLAKPLNLLKGSIRTISCILDKYLEKV